jgi:hypothetical protein
LQQFILRAAVDGLGHQAGGLPASIRDFPSPAGIPEVLPCWLDGLPRALSSQRPTGVRHMIEPFLPVGDR